MARGLAAADAGVEAAEGRGRDVVRFLLLLLLLPCVCLFATAVYACFCYFRCMLPSLLFVCWALLWMGWMVCFMDGVADRAALYSGGGWHAGWISLLLLVSMAAALGPGINCELAPLPVHKPRQPRRCTHPARQHPSCSVALPDCRAYHARLCSNAQASQAELDQLQLPYKPGMGPPTRASGGASGACDSCLTCCRQALC